MFSFVRFDWPYFMLSSYNLWHCCFGHKQPPLANFSFVHHLPCNLVNKHLASNFCDTFHCIFPINLLFWLHLLLCVWVKSIC